MKLNVPKAMIVAAVGAVGIAGCGGGSKSSSSSSGFASSSPTKTAFIARADRVCGKAVAQISPVNAQLQTAATPTAVASLLRQEQSITQSGASAMNAIPEPPGDKGTIATLIGQIDSEAVQLGRIASAAARNDVATVRTEDSRLNAVHVNYQRIARAYGFQVCGQPDRKVSTDGKFSTIIPTGFSDATSSAQGGPFNLLYLAVGPVVRTGRVNINVIRESARGRTDMDAIARAELAGIKSIEPGASRFSPVQALTVDGPAARAVDYFNPSAGHVVHQRQIFVAHGDRIYTITYTAPPEGYTANLSALDQVVREWLWR